MRFEPGSFGRQTRTIQSPKLTSWELFLSISFNDPLHDCQNCNDQADGHQTG